MRDNGDEAVEVQDYSWYSKLWSGNIAQMHGLNGQSFGRLSVRSEEWTFKTGHLLTKRTVRECRLEWEIERQTPAGLINSRGFLDADSISSFSQGQFIYAGLTYKVLWAD